METQTQNSFESVPQGSGRIDFKVPERVDAFNFSDVREELSAYFNQSQAELFMDLSRTSFLSFPMIRYVAELAERLSQSGGRLTIVGPTEKLKRQISIYASLDHIEVKDLRL